MKVCRWWYNTVCKDVFLWQVSVLLYTQQVFSVIGFKGHLRIFVYIISSQRLPLFPLLLARGAPFFHHHVSAKAVCILLQGHLGIVCCFFGVCLDENDVICSKAV